MGPDSPEGGGTPSLGPRGLTERLGLPQEPSAVSICFLPAVGAGGQALLSGPVSEPTEPQRHRLFL